ncbi:MAG: phosphohistidine phosphatase SixA [candidate division Zixibacteria bacterium]
MRLYLVQHALAKPKDEDPNRSLSEQGLAELSKIMTFLETYENLRIGAIFHSGKTRALQTAEEFHKQLQPQPKLIESHGLGPMDSPGIWKEKANNLDNESMIVGHLPHLGRLASLLICGVHDIPIIRFYNSGIVCLNRDNGSNWIFEWAVIPNILK